MTTEPDDWCEYHRRVEPITDDTYKICGECWHAFTKDELLTESRKHGNFRDINFRDINKIYSCPLCAHDF